MAMESHILAESHYWKYVENSDENIRICKYAINEFRKRGRLSQMVFCEFRPFTEVESYGSDEFWYNLMSGIQMWIHLVQLPVSHKLDPPGTLRRQGMKDRVLSYHCFQLLALRQISESRTITVHQHWTPFSLCNDVIPFSRSLCQGASPPSWASEFYK